MSIAHARVWHIGLDAGLEAPSPQTPQTPQTSQTLSRHPTGPDSPDTTLPASREPRQAKPSQTASSREHATGERSTGGPEGRGGAVVDGHPSGASTPHGASGSPCVRSARDGPMVVASEAAAGPDSPRTPGTPGTPSGVPGLALEVFRLRRRVQRRRAKLRGGPSEAAGTPNHAVEEAGGEDEEEEAADGDLDGDREDVDAADADDAEGGGGASVGRGVVPLPPLPLPVVLVVEGCEHGQSWLLRGLPAGSVRVHVLPPSVLEDASSMPRVLESFTSGEGAPHGASHGAKPDAKPGTPSMGSALNGASAKGGAAASQARRCAVAALLLEPVAGQTGACLSTSAAAALRAACTAYGVPIVSDETRAGLGRCVFFRSPRRIAL